MLVLVADKKLDVNELMLINSVTQSYGSEGFTTNLELVGIECYSLNIVALSLIRKGF